MGKRGRERQLKDNEAKAVARMLRVSPQKLNLVAQMIRGKKVDTALADCPLDGVAVALRLSGAGVLPSTKWKKI